MTDDQPTAPGQAGFVRWNERPDQLPADPQLAAGVAAAQAGAEEMDRVHAMNLEMIRKAAHVFATVRGNEKVPVWSQVQVSAGGQCHARAITHHAVSGLYWPTQETLIAQRA